MFYATQIYYRNIVTSMNNVLGIMFFKIFLQIKVQIVLYITIIIS